MSTESSPNSQPTRSVGRIFKTLFLWGSFAALMAIIVLVFASVVAWRNLPSVDTLKDYKPRMAMQIFSEDGQLIGEFGEERRRPVLISEVPDHLKKALIAIEDARFYEHGGIDYLGLGRAIVNNVTGGNKQGASTITQQLAKNFFLTNERTFTRKFYEALMAKKIEQNLTKDEILERYMNHIYLGERAYGFAAAADIYFGKELKDLTLAESAMLATLPQAPSSNNPARNRKRADERQRYVLERMLELNFITKAQYDQARAEVVQLVDKKSNLRNDQSTVHADYIAEMARMLMYDRFKEAAYTEGLKVYTTIRSQEQNAAYAAVRKAVFAYDRKYGYRGAEAQYNLPSKPEERLKMLDTIFDEHPDLDNVKAVVVLSTSGGILKGVTSEGKEIELKGASLGPAKSLLGSGDKKGIRTGSVVRVIESTDGLEYRITQVPSVQASFISMDPTDGAIHALVGGFDFQLSKFNHVTQGYRQPGSTIKPFIYSAAMEKNGMNPNSIVDDKPIKIGSWEPKNSDGRYLGPIPLSTALASSRNMVSIRLLQSIGNDYFRSYAERFGFEGNRIDKYLTVALGAIEVTPYEMVGAYGVFANGGYKVDPYFIKKVVDRSGAVILEAKPRLTSDEKNRVITKENAAMTDALLKGVVRGGTARAASALGRSDIAGKTGTTNDAVDAWFAGYQPKLVAVAWMGFDTGNKSLGEGEFGGGLALPIWMDYMRMALQGKKVEVRETQWQNAVTNAGGNITRNPTDPSLTIDGQPAPPPAPEELNADPNSVPLPNSDARKASETVNEADVKAASEGKLQEIIAPVKPAAPAQPKPVKPAGAPN
ncbi:MAG: PBP1A family penicillin-binding protein [Burkholderiales bacterium]|nr:PBP1A family penicillin-binding protein [Burkholderiales bacterium]MCE1176126.1 PBP1A family penicillin-binding protein [Burkholderiales bacterium]